MKTESLCLGEPQHRRRANHTPARRGFMRSLVAACLAALAASFASAILPGGASDAHAQRMISLVAPKRTASVGVAVFPDDAPR